MKSACRSTLIATFACIMGVLPAIATETVETKAKLLSEALTSLKVEEAGALLEDNGSLEEALKLLKIAAQDKRLLGPKLTYSVLLDQKTETITVYNAVGQSVQPVAAVVFERSKKDVNK
jgi:hypothetical protein